MRAREWLLVTLTCVAAGAIAQGPPPDAAGGAPREPGRRMGSFGSPSMDGMLMRLLAPDSKTAKDIGLTEEQAVELRKLLTSSQTEMKDSRTEMEQLAMKQAELLSQDSPDEAAVMKVVEELGELRTQIAKQQIKQLLAAQKILTPEQRTKLRDQAKARIEQFRESRKEGRGPRDGAVRPTQPPPPNPAVQ